jgi:RNase H-fold protein (predicted Holliday junction resolvase)
MIIAVDPGSDKCGLAVVNSDGTMMEKKIVARQNITAEILALQERYRNSALIIGESASGKKLVREINGTVAGPLIFIQEKDSTRQARMLYWKENPPAGWRKFIPRSLLFPPVAVDDYAAVVLAGRYLNR